MTAKQIREGMTKGEWVETHDRCIQADDDKGAFIADCGFVNHMHDNAHVYNAAAITTAVNSTYGQGYDPVKLLEFVRAFEAFCNKGTFKDSYPKQGVTLSELLKSTKL